MMINEFHTSLLYRKTSVSSVVGEDYQVPGLEFPPLGPSAMLVRRSLLLQPERPESANWRALEIRRAIEKTDLSSMLSHFDMRTGYLIDELLGEMSSLFRPRVVGDHRPSDLKLSGNYTSFAYRLDTWHVTVGAAGWTVESLGFNAITGDNSGDAFTPVPLPGHGESMIVPTDQPGEYWIQWAARPNTSFATTANELRTVAKPAIVTLSNEPQSRFGADERQLLQKIAVGDGEDVAQVCAAALLFAGYAAEHVRRQNRSSP